MNQDSPSEMNFESSVNKKKTEIIREFFPETWLWDIETLRYNLNLQTVLIIQCYFLILLNCIENFFVTKIIFLTLNSKRNLQINFFLGSCDFKNIFICKN